MRRGMTVLLIFLAGTCFGPIVYGALGSAFWKTGSHIDKYDYIYRIYAETGLNPAYDAVTKYESKNCEKPEWNAENEVKLFAYSAYFSRWLSSRYDQAIADDLYRLPASIIGGLDGCIGGSPLASICVGYVRQRADHTIWSLDTAKGKWLAEGEQAIRRAWPQWCQKDLNLIHPE